MLVRKGVLSHKPLRIYPLVVAQMLALNTQNVQSLFSAASPHASLPHANDVFLEINKHSTKRPITSNTLKENVFSIQCALTTQRDLSLVRL